jgi:hypothetical protein
VANRRVLAVVLVVLGIVWILINGPVEGPILFKFAPDHGLTTADLLSLAAFVLAVLLWFDRTREPPRR